MYAVDNELKPFQLRGFKLLHEQVDDLRHTAANPRQRIHSGLRALDLMTLGPAAGEVHTYVARSHTGKSMLATNWMVNNPDEHILFFSLEMTADAVLQRMYAHHTETPGRDVVRMTMRNQLPDTIDWIGKEFEYQVVVDRPALTLGDMSVYLESYDNFFGFRPDLVIIDYLEEVGGAKASGEGWTRTEATASAMKAWAKDERVGVVSLHQANQKTEQWEPPTAGSAKGGGYTESDIVCGIYRPGWDPDLGDIERRQTESHLYINVIKNRVNGRMTSPDHPLKFKLTDSGKLVDIEYQKTLDFYGEY